MMEKIKNHLRKGKKKKKEVCHHNPGNKDQSLDSGLCPRMEERDDVRDV